MNVVFRGKDDAGESNYEDIDDVAATNDGQAENLYVAVLPEPGLEGVDPPSA